MSARSILVFAVSLLTGGVTFAEPLTYGSFKYHPEIPGALFLTDEIKSNDSFELRRAMRDQPINLVITASPGGNLYEGLQIAAILNDNRISTYIPDGASCESSCANVFLGGFHRMVIGELGVHQFYSSSSNAAASARKDITTATTQYTASEIIGIMNQFETPPFVYEKMFGTVNIYYFKGSEKLRLNRNISDAVFIDKVAEIEEHLVSSPTILEQMPAEPAQPNTTKSPTASDPQASQPKVTMVERAHSFLTAINYDWSLPNEQSLLRIQFYYADSVDFYGKKLTYLEVMAEKKVFALRWPLRSYQVEPASVRITCTERGCTVNSVIAWVAKSPERGKAASGRSTWNLLLAQTDNGLMIVSEDGKTFVRR